MEWVSDDKLDYLDHYGLDKEPFDAEVDRVSFFQDAVITQRLGMLQHFSRYSDLLLLVVGQFGSGKTTLMEHFIDQVEEEVRVSRVDASPTMSRETLLIAIGKGFGLPPVLEGDLNAFIKQLQELLQFDEGGLLVIDDAHLLPADTLRYALELAEISGRQGKLLRLILFAEPSIEQVLADPGVARLGERITHTLDIPALDLERTEAYIHHRMQAVGHDGENPFPRAVMKRIHKGAHGLPLRINELAQEHLLQGSEGGEGISLPIGKGYLIAIAAVIITVTVVVILLGRLESRPATTTQDGASDRIVTLPLNGADETAPPPRLKGWSEEVGSAAESTAADGAVEGPEAVEGEPAESVSEAPVETVTVDSAPADPAPTDAVPEEPAAETETETVEAAPEPAAPEIAQPEIKQVRPQPVVGSPRRQSITVDGRNFHPEARVRVGWTGSSRLLDNWQVRVVSEEQIVFRVVTGIQSDTWTVRIINPGERGSNVASFQVVSPRSQQAKQVEEEADKSGEQDWLFGRDPEHYTVQVLASRQGEAVTNFMKQHGLSKAGVVVSTRKQGELWYYLVYGDYATREQADEVTEALAQRVPGSQPWARSMQSLQQMVLGGRLEDAAWIKVQSGSRYTLQLVAGSSGETVRDFVGKYGLTDQAAVYQTTRDGKPWYVLVYGVYDSQQAAQAAAADLPAAVRQMQPWARSFASVQADIP
ncbi:MAG: SPOR domain-containing protein [Gammaproteobacteria bacterium]|nr:SPOR domain-containing protein [Gammaproteobacteria bacterium]